MRVVPLLFLALTLIIPSVSLSKTIDGYHDVKFNMSLEEVTSIINADKNGTIAQSMWSIFRLTRFEASFGCLLDDGRMYDQRKLIDVYNAVRGVDGKLFDVEVLSYADMKTGQQVQVYFYKNKVMYIVVATSVGYETTLKTLSEKFGDPVKCGSKFKEDYFRSSLGGIKVSRYAVEYFNIPLCKEHADAMAALVRDKNIK